MDSDTRVRLPELAGSAASLVPPGLSDQRIDILRRSSSPRPVKDSWDQDPGLQAPVAVLPIGDGIAALVAFMEALMDAGRDTVDVALLYGDILYLREQYDRAVKTLSVDAVVANDAAELARATYLAYPY